MNPFYLLTNQIFQQEYFNYLLDLGNQIHKPRKHCWKYLSSKGNNQFKAEKYDQSDKTMEAEFLSHLWQLFCPW